MIIEEVNQVKDKEKEISEEIKKIWELIEFGNITFPHNYNLEELGDSLKIICGKFFKGIIAELKLRGDVIEIYFTDEKDLEKLRNCFKDSKTKFKLIVGEN